MRRPPETVRLSGLNRLSVITVPLWCDTVPTERNPATVATESNAVVDRQPCILIAARNVLYIYRRSPGGGRHRIRR